MDKGTCLVCNESFPQTPGRGRPRKYCSDKCKGWASRHLNVRACEVDGCARPHAAKGLCTSHYNARFGNRPKPRPVECTVCGKTVMKAQKEKGRRVVCSIDCRTILTWGRPKPTNALVHVGPAPMPVRTTTAPTVVIKSTRGVFTNGSCDWCGKEFNRLSFAAPARACSRKCSRSLNKSAQAHRGLWISPLKRLAIYERDDWTCQICGGSVDADLPVNDTWAASLDHIIPQSHQLIPDHSPDALRLAHRWCNAVRGDLTYYTDADLAAV